MSRPELSHRDLAQALDRRSGHWFPALRRQRRLLGRNEPPTPVDYASGDDLLQVDWPRCARHDELIVRQRPWSPRPALWLAIDCSASMRLGEPAKLAFACDLAASLARVALGNRAPVGVIGFADDWLKELPLRHGMSRAGEIEAFLAQLAPQAKPASLARMAAAWTKASRPPLAGSWVLLLSDLLDPKDAAAGAETIARLGGEPGFVQTLDRRDVSPDLAGRVELTDPETGRRLRVRVGRSDLANYRTALRRRCESLAAYGRRRQLLCVAAPTWLGLPAALAEVLQAGRALRLGAR